jgi:glycerol-3-phosphate O-acyltransferase
VILSREVRHSILKITPGGDGEKDALPEKPLPADATSEALHERHVAAELHEHAPVEATVVETVVVEETANGDTPSKD